MKFKSIALGAALMVAGTALAGIGNISSFPGQRPVSQFNGEARNIQRAPLNPNKDKGTKIFGYTTLDYDGIRHYVDFYSSNPRNINKLNDILVGGSYDESMPRNIGCVGGAWAGDAYYTYRLFYYTFTTRVIDWIKVDPKTGKSQEIRLVREIGADDPSWWSPLQGMMWNPTDGKLYALAQNTDGSITSVIKTVDRATGIQSNTKALSKYYFSAAFSYDNELYAITWKYDDKGNITGTLLDVLDPEDNFDVISSNELLVDGKPWIIYYDNNITFDYTTGELWWNAVQVSNYKEFLANPQTVVPQEDIRLIKIDPRSNTTENFGDYGTMTNIGGMYIDYDIAESRTAPAIVENTSFTIDPQGADKVTINWTNPTMRWNRSKLSNLASVEIYRDSYPGSPVGTVTATGKEGQKMSFTDDKASAGIHTYYIVAVNAAGKGVPAKINAFVGKDVPGPVNNLTASTTDGKSIHLEWSKPTRGDNEGWFDDSDLSYTITRLPDNVNLGTIKTTSYDDKTLGDAQMYRYVIATSNSKGSGAGIESNAVYAGNGIRPPFSTKFETKIEADRFSTLDKNGDYNTFEYKFNVHNTLETFGIIFSNYDNDDVLVSPTLKVEKGKSYKITYTLNFGSLNIPGTRDIKTPFRLIGGTQPTVEAMTDILFEDLEHENTLPMDVEEYVVYFTAPVDGDYYVGLETLVKQETELWMYVEGFEIDNAPSDDLDAQEIDCYLYLSTLNNNSFGVKVYNNGDKTQNKYTVKLAVLDDSGNPEVFAETEDVPEIKAHESQIVKMSAKMPSLGEKKLVAIVDLKGDGNDSNNMTVPMTVMSDETEPLNFTANIDDKETALTNVPFNHYFPCTATQTIYTPAMTLLDRIYPDQTPTITRIAWEGTSTRDFPAFEDTQITVYMSQTDEAGYDKDSPQFLDVDSEPLFDDFVPLKGGRNYVVVDFDEPFPFNPKKSIVVTVLKEDQVHGDWLFAWRTFDENWVMEKFHSVHYTGTTPIDITSPEGRILCYPNAPVLHLAIQGISAGLGHLVMTGNSAVLYNPATSSVETSGYPVASVEVFNQAGQLLERVEGNGAESVRINSANGLYLIKVNGVDGTSLSLKTII